MSDLPLELDRAGGPNLAYSVSSANQPRTHSRRAPLAQPRRIGPA